jgi:hypothetical protein
MAVLSVALILSGCAAQVPAPASSVRSTVGNVKFINDQADSSPRQLFANGINTATTNYKGWTDVIITKVQERWEPQSTSPKVLKFSTSSINCSGFYVPDCSIALLVERGDGAKKVYTTPSLSGYPFDSAIGKALDAVAQIVVDDQSLQEYISQK